MGERVLLRDLIHIPERVHQGDFVLKLTEGVRDAEATVRDYVVTPQLRRCFDEALAFIQGAVEGQSSKACYLHGSFGAGKSHFMAVLNLLLEGNVPARSIPELADVVARHNAWTEGRRFLMVPYHMIGARDMESAVLGQYAEHVRRLHPDAPVPGFYLAESLFEGADRLRAKMGDEAFFTALNESEGGGDGWGDLEEGGWDAVSFESATLEPPQGDERQRLISDLIKTFYPQHGHIIQGKDEAFVALDDGLSIMSQHAKRLGYDAVVLFLDELILWLATRAADVNFVASEGTKLVKLVEAQRSDRPIPLVSFVARQRDLRDLVGENLAGALQLGFTDVLKHWEARQPQLFGDAPVRGGDWIGALLASPTYAAQRRLAGRGAPRDEDVRRLLAALETRGGRLSQTALAQAMAVPAVRIPTIVQATRRVLNVDQAPVLRPDPESGAVTLDHELLRVQFELPRG